MSSSVLESLETGTEALANANASVILGITSSCLSLAANATATGLIGYRTLYVAFGFFFLFSDVSIRSQHQRFMKEMMGAGKSKAEKVLTLLLESGAIYCVMQVSPEPCRISQPVFIRVHDWF